MRPRLGEPEDHALLVDLCPPLLVARVHAELSAGHFDVVALHGFYHSAQGGLDSPAKVEDIPD